MRGNNLPTASGTAQEGEVEHGPRTETSRRALCVYGEGGGAGVLLPLLWDLIQKSGPADPQQRILKWGQSSFNGHRRVRFRYTKCEFSITSLGIFKPHVKWSFELNTFSVCHWLDTQIALPSNSHFSLWRQDTTGENIFYDQFWDFRLYCFHNVSSFRLEINGPKQVLFLLYFIYLCL